MGATADAKKAKRTSINSNVGVQLLLVLEIWLRCNIWGLAMALTLLVVARTEMAEIVRTLSWDKLHSWRGAWAITEVITKSMVMFSVSYVLVLIAIRLIIPTPRRGVYKLAGGMTWRKRDLFFAGILGILTKARYNAPFPGVFVPHVANIMPFRWLLSLQFGPKSKTSFFVDPQIMDPWGVTIGRNTTVGYGATISAHLHERDSIIIDPVEIEDDAVVGAETGVPAGTRIRRGALLEPYSALKPGLVLEEGELWGGRPARKIGMYRAGTSANTPIADTEPAAPQA